MFEALKIYIHVLRKRRGDFAISAKITPREKYTEIHNFEIHRTVSCTFRKLHSVMAQHLFNDFLFRCPIDASNNNPIGKLSWKHKSITLDHTG